MNFNTFFESLRENEKEELEKLSASTLLEMSAPPFDIACMKVREMEQQLSQANDRIKELKRHLDDMSYKQSQIKIKSQKETIQTLCEMVLDAANDLFVYTNNPKTAEFLREKYRNLVAEIQK
jgi:TolA-binding protein